MATYKHGVYVSEQATSITPPIEGTAGLQVIVGTAPINMADDPYNVTNKPVICYSFAEAAAALGYSDDFVKYTVCQSIDASFRVFNVAPIVVINVLDPKSPEHIKTVENASHTFALGQTYLYDGTDKATGILLDKVTVKSADGTSEYKKDKDYILSFDSKGYVLVTLLKDSAIKADDSVQISYTALNPDGVTVEDIIGGYDATTGNVTGLECINKVFPMFGLTPGLLLAPGWSDDANVIAAMEAKCTGINGNLSCNCLVDIGTDKENAIGTAPTSARKYSDVRVAKENLGVDSPLAIACWPLGKVGDKVYALSALNAALLAYTDASNEDVPYVSPSNKSMGITGLCLEDGTSVVLDQEQANTVNSFGVLTAINYNGYKSWGNNTAAYPSTTDPKDRWIAVKRMFVWWANTLILTYHQKVDDPMNFRLIESIVDSENIRGNSFVARGMCAAARIEYLSSENPVTALLNGTVKFHIHISPYIPTEDIDFVLEFDPKAIQKALEGGN